MKFTIRKQDLQGELGLIQGVVEPKATIPILSHLLLRAEKDGLRLLATDLEIGLRTGLSADVSDPGSATVPAKKLHDVVRSLSCDVVSFETESNNWLRVEGGSFRGRVVGLQADDFPPQPDFPDVENPIRLPLVTFQRLLARVLFAVTTENTRFSINGALMKINREVMTLVATDGHRLALVTQPVELPDLAEETSVLVPRKALAELGRMKSDEDAELELAAKDNHVFFRAGERTVFSRTLEGTYPNYEKVIPEASPSRAVVERSSLADGLSRVSVLTSDTSKLVAFDFSSDGVTLSTSNPNMGEASETVPCEWEGDAVKIGLNCEYVLNFLQVVGTEKVEIHLKDGAAQALFSPVGEESGRYQYVVMPMRLS